MNAAPPVGQDRIDIKMGIEVLPGELNLVLDTMFIALCISLPCEIVLFSPLSP